MSKFNPLQFQPLAFQPLAFQRLGFGAGEALAWVDMKSGLPAGTTFARTGVAHILMPPSYRVDQVLDDEPRLSIRRVFNWNDYVHTDPGWNDNGLGTSVAVDTIYDSKQCDSVTFADGATGGFGSNRARGTTLTLVTEMDDIDHLATLEIAVSRALASGELIRIGYTGTMGGPQRELNDSSGFTAGEWTTIVLSKANMATGLTNLYFTIYPINDITGGDLTIYLRGRFLETNSKFPPASVTTAGITAEYRDYANGNSLAGSGSGAPDTLTSWVTLTEAQGASLTDSAYRGVVIEREHTASVLYSFDPSTSHSAWVLRPNITKVSEETSEVIIGANAVNYSSTASAANRRIDQTFTAISIDNDWATLYAVVEGDTATQCQLNLRDVSGGNWPLRVNISFGVGAVDTSLSLGSADVETWLYNLGNDVWMIFASVKTPAASGAQVDRIDYYPAGSGAVSGASTLHVCGAYAGRGPTGMIKTLAASATRSGETLRIPSSDAALNAVWTNSGGSLLLDVYMNSIGAVSGDERTLWDFGNGRRLYLDDAGQITLVDGTNTITGATITADNAPAKIGVTWGASTAALAYNGTASGSGSFTQSLAATYGIGCLAAAAGSQLDGMMRAYFPDEEVTSSKLASRTRL